MTKPKKHPHPVDIHVGKQLRARRISLGLSQTAVAERLGLTFQQLQKNEKATNRIGAGRLYDLAEILDVPVSYFFDGYDETAPPPLPEMDPDVLVIAALIQRVSDPNLRRRIKALLRAVTDTKSRDVE